MYKNLIAGLGVAALAGSVMLAGPAFADPIVPAPGPSAQTTPGFKADFAWSAPANPNGAAYTSCDVSLFRTDGSLAFSAPYPADMPKLTLQFGATELTTDPIIPGTTGLSLSYVCTNGTDTSDVQTISSVAIPDVPPTAPDVPVLTAVGSDGLQVQFGGSEAIGVSPLLGYQVNVDRNNTSYTSAKYNDAVGTMTTASLSHDSSRVHIAAVTTASNGLFENLPAGSYTVEVSAFNAVGASDAVAATQQIIIGAAGTGAGPSKVAPVNPNGARSVTVKTAARSVTVSWKAPVADARHAAVSRYRVIVSLHGKAVATKTVSASTTHLTVRGLKPRKTYLVQVNTYGVGSASVHTARTVTTKKR